MGVNDFGNGSRGDDAKGVQLSMAAKKRGPAVDRSRSAAGGAGKKNLGAAMDREKKTALNQLKELADELSNEGKKPEMVSPLDEFIRNKASTMSGAKQVKSSHFTGKPDADSGGSLRQAAAIARKKPLGPYNPSAALRPAAAEAPKGSSVVQSRKVAPELPFAKPQKTHVVPFTISNEQSVASPSHFQTVTASLDRSPRDFSELEASMAQRPQIRRKQPMNRPAVLQAIFSVADSSESLRGAQSQVAKPAEDTVTADAGRDVASPAAAAVTGDGAKEDAAASGGKSQQLQQVLALAEATARRKQESGSFQQLYAGGDSATGTPSQTLFSIAPGEAPPAPDWDAPADIAAKADGGGTDPVPEQPVITESDPGAVSQPVAADREGAKAAEPKAQEVVVGSASGLPAIGDHYWVVPVESFSTGIAHMLGDMVGGVVAVGRNMAESDRMMKIALNKPEVQKQVAKSAAAPRKRGQIIKDFMAGKVGSGVWSVMSGVGQVAKGGAGIVVGSLGCLGGALVCISGAEVGSETRSGKKKLVRPQLVQKDG